MLSKSQKCPAMRQVNSPEQDIFFIHFNRREGDLVRQKVQKLADRLYTKKRLIKVLCWEKWD